MKTAAGFIVKNGSHRLVTVWRRQRHQSVAKSNCANRPYWHILNYPPEYFTNLLDLEHLVAIRAVKCALGSRHFAERAALAGYSPVRHHAVAVPVNPGASGWPVVARSELLARIPGAAFFRVCHLAATRYAGPDTVETILDRVSD